VPWPEHFNLNNHAQFRIVPCIARLGYQAAMVEMIGAIPSAAKIARRIPIYMSLDVVGQCPALLYTFRPSRCSSRSIPRVVTKWLLKIRRATASSSSIAGSRKA